MKQIFTKSGYKNELSVYSLKCGYIQTRNGKTLSVLHNLYEVSTTNLIKYFTTIKAARKYLYKK